MTRFLDLAAVWRESFHPAVASADRQLEAERLLYEAGVSTEWARVLTPEEVSRAAGVGVLVSVCDGLEGIVTHRGVRSSSVALATMIDFALFIDGAIAEANRKAMGVPNTP